VKSFSSLIWLGALLCTWALVQASQAQEAEDAPVSGFQASADEEARGFFIAGRASYLAGRYDEALERFERSYEMSGRAELLYNIGNAAYKAGKSERALSAYRWFLDKQPASDQRAEVERRIAELEAKVSTEPALAAPSAAPGPARTEVASRPANVAVTSALAPSLTLAVSGAALVTGVVLAVLGYKAEQRVRNAPDGADWDDYSDDAAHAMPFRIAGIALGAAGAAGTALATWWLVRTRADAPSAQLSVGLGHVRVQGAF
jgi:tetratricopeptide (TPR) repeat protein